MHPEGARAGIASAGAQRCLHVPASRVDSVVTGTPALDATERLDIYGRSYYARLRECFHTSFPVLLHALGAEVFDGFAFDYLRSYPPRSYTLNRLAENFPRYLRETRPDVDAAPDARETWPDFIIELATLETTFNEVFDGPGAEGQPILQRKQLQSLSRSAWPQVRLQPVPSLKLLTFSYPVANYFNAVRKRQNPALPTAAATDTCLAVNRRAYEVVFYELSQVEYKFLSLLLENKTLETVLAHTADTSGSTRKTLNTNLKRRLYRWIDDEFFLTLEFEA